ncbi:glycosyltransferase [Methylobacterium segetis]|uniref:glycosyltransferase n=1 Tax=Methylobacterium segetis TaxID=2488750 RepID=UPI0014055C94|nr:glycosyltransferase [Methylobacterium segetis]
MRYLSLATYPISVPRHGGQIRVNALHRVLRERGWITEHIAVYEAAAQPEEPDSEFLFPVSAGFRRELTRREGRVDVDASDVLLQDPEAWQRFCRVVDEFHPDIIACEQAWLWPALREYLRQRPGIDVRILYSSQNVEGHLIENVTAAQSAEGRARLASRAREIEDDLASRADAIIVVSTHDHDHFAPVGKPILVAPNGVWPLVPPPAEDHWRRTLSLFSTMVFVGSGHPPNAVGFAEMLGPRMSYLAPDERIIVVGSVAGLLDRTPGYADWYGLNAARLIVAGVQDEAGLSTLFDLAGGVVLPITLGGGTNLKTAEALYNRKRIVATTTAMRGYEDFIGFPGLTIHDEPDAFKQAVRACLSERAAPLTYTIEQMELLDGLLWSSTLRRVGPFLSLLLAGKRPAVPRASKPGSETGPDSRHSLTPHLFSGWYGAEPNGVWSKETVAILRIETEPGQPMPMRVRCLVTGMASKGRPQAIDVFCPSGHKANLTYRYKARAIPVAFEVTEDDIDPSGVLEIYFQVNRLVSPRDLGRSADDRKLGLCLVSMTIDRAVGTSDGKPPPRGEGVIRMPHLNAARRIQHGSAAFVRAIGKRMRPKG